MGAETVYNITIPSTSATLAYSPYVIDNANSGGWQSLCPTNVTNNDTSSWICDPDSAHTTSSYKASFELSFNGVGIYLIGNTTNNLGYDISLDGVYFPGNFRSNAQLLYSYVGLQPGLHTISLTVRQPVLADNPGSVTLKEVVVDAGTGRSRATVIKTVLDDDDPSIAYAPSNGNWTIVNAYPQTTQPAGIKSSTFHDSYSTNATATIGFKGVGISVYGACYSHSEYAAYSASIDGTEEIQYNGTVNLYSIGGDVKQRAGNCLRYFKTGLDADKDHQLVLKVKDMGRLAVDWVEVFSVEGGQQRRFINGTGGQGDGSNVMSNNTRVAIIAGAVSAGVVLILALLTLIFCIRRERSRPQDILTPAPTQNGVRTQEDGSYIITPFTPERLHTQTDSHGTSAMLSRPQPQTPAPSAFDRYRTGAPVIQSYSLGDAPLASPGLLTMSSYTGSSGSGPGWPDSADYQTTAFNYTAPLSPSTSRPSYTGRVSSSSSGPGLTFVGGEPIGGGIGVSEAGSSVGLRQDPRTYAGDAAGPVSSSTSPAPPVYERIQVPGGRGRIGRVERVR